MIAIDDSKQHVMKAHLRGDGYVMLVWPKDLLLRDLEIMRECVNLQIDNFIRSAKVKTLGELEWDSWFDNAAVLKDARSDEEAMTRERGRK